MDQASSNAMIPENRFDDFTLAASYARWLAKKYGSQTAIQRDGEGWRVYVSPFIATVQKIYEYDDLDEPDENERNEWLNEIVGEFVSDQGDWSRSEEAGWFYSDRD
jgi:hypothetical protein